jgi:formylglycine-generating enzyme required for sulfatase activity
MPTAKRQNVSARYFKFKENSMENMAKARTAPVIGIARLAAAIVITSAALFMAGCETPDGEGGSDSSNPDSGGTPPAGMVRISGGTFTMGSPASEEGRFDNETQRQVTLSGFYMGKYQVTQEEYQAVMGANPSYFTAAVSGESGTPGKLPVESVSWYDAIVFCNRLSVKEGLSPAYSINGSANPDDWGTVPTDSNDAAWDAVTIVAGSNGYRLPTEAQWEYACRAGTTTAFNTGNIISDNTGWYSANSGSKTHQVGLKPANAWGLHDMHGNVWEWCWDWYGAYPNSAQTDPVGASSGSDRVWRGGSWYDVAGHLRSASRDYYIPYYRNNDLGFRLVRP